MASIHDVEPIKLIEKAADELAKIKEVAAPEWSSFVKTGVHKERPPIQENWWHIRAGAILRTIYLMGPIGVSKLRSKYGGGKNRGLKPKKFKKGSGKIIRTILQQLDAAGLTKVAEKGKGRILTPKGQSLLDNISNQLAGTSKVKATKKPRAEERNDGGDVRRGKAFSAKVEEKKEAPKEEPKKEAAPVVEKSEETPKEEPKQEVKKDEFEKDIGKEEQTNQG